MKTFFVSTACALLLSTTFAAAQSSQGKGGAPMTSESADPSKTPGTMSTGKSMKKKSNMGASGMSGDKMGGSNKNGDGQMSKGGMQK